jgi:RNA polymerase sigma-70 factor (ECF subfamily)|tara:strand:+ start:19639 stop:20214 length:576 start_codon:yes stop_codon:yes gene_type:complete
LEISNEILEGCIANKRKSQFLLYKQCYSILLSICLRYEKNKEDAEFLLNQGFMKIITKLSTFKGDRPFEAWIRRIMINTIIDDYRKNSKEKSIIQFKDIQNDGTENIWVEYNAADLEFEAEELLGFIDKLPTESKKVFVLFAIDGYSHKEIAEMLGISDGTSKWHVSFARKKLRELIAKSIELEALRAGNL